MADADYGHSGGASHGEAGDGSHGAGDPKQLGHDAGHGHGHGHEEDGEPLGPVDIVTWAYAAAGVAIGVVTALALNAASAT